MAVLSDSASWTCFTHFLLYLNVFCSRPEAASDDLSTVVVEDTSTDICVKFHDSRTNGSRDIRVVTLC